MKNLIFRTAKIMLFLLFACSSMVFAKVSADEAENLKSNLTPIGAERAGNADGSIPPWEGGLSSVPAGLDYKGPGTLRPDPYAQDKVLYTINAGNAGQYADKLSEGVKAMMERYPDTFRIDVYPTRRSAAFPQYVYDNTYANATLCETTADRLGIVTNGGSKGLPFPIPNNAEEVMFNNNLGFQGGALNGDVAFSVVQANGTRADSLLNWNLKYPWYDPNAGKDSEFARMGLVSIAYTKVPAKLKGNVALVWDPLNQSVEPRSAWSYLPGQRRVRRAPTVAYDTPNSTASGLINYDDIYVFNGALDRYDWKLVGKKELFIPYNDYAASFASIDDLMTPRHFNPDYMRWELHRVWVVEASLKEGKRHAVAKRTIYLDEDSWMAALGDSYDSHGKLWRTYWASRLQAYEVPSNIGTAQFGFDFQRSDYAGLYMINGLPKQPVYGVYPPDSVFTPDYVRTLGTR